jgi:uncharacterized protein YdaU (DUF1376 family)
MRSWRSIVQRAARMAPDRQTEFDRLPWLPLDTGIYLSTTAHLTLEQHGCYLLLTLHYWVNGGLPADDAQLAAICRLSPRRWQQNKAVLAAFFGDDWNTHERLNKDLAKAKRIRLQRRAAGALGGFHSSRAKARQDKYSRALRRGLQASAQANGAANGEANWQAKGNRPVTKEQLHILNPSSSEEGTGRAREAKVSEATEKRPNEATRAEMEAAFAKRKASP